MAGLVPATRPIEGKLGGTKALDLLAEELWILFGNEMPRVLGNHALNVAGFLSVRSGRLREDPERQP